MGKNYKEAARRARRASKMNRDALEMGLDKKDRKQIRRFTTEAYYYD